MATKKKTPKPKTNSCVPSCFGFGGSVSAGPKKAPADTKSPKKSSPSSSPNWLSWSRFRKRKSGSSKTVPVVDFDKSTQRGADTVTEIANGVTTTTTKGVSDKTARKRQSSSSSSRWSTTHICRDAGEAKGDLEKSRKRSGKIQRAESHNSIPAVESRKASAIVDTCSDDGSVRRKSESMKTGTRSESPSANPSRSLTASSSFPPPGRRKSVQAAVTSLLSGRETDRGDDTVAGKFGPAVGMTILIMTLAILLLWGRLFAVVCTSAWLYFVPRLNKAGNSDDVAGKQPDCQKPDLDSSEYKKKVVLEGLLERNHRNPVAGAP